MKKFFYLCAMMLLSMDIMAQIDPYDRNWKVVVFDDFDQPNRQFDSTFQEPDSLWTAFSHWLHPSGVTKSAYNILQIYQWSQCHIDVPNSVLKLCAEYIRSNEISCDDQPDFYELPPPIFGKNYYCDGEKKYLYYKSGMIESYPVYDLLYALNLVDDNGDDDDRSPWRGRFRYGYFEIRCKLPVHQGAFPAFWLWGSKKNPEYYESIDIFEYSWAFTDQNSMLGSPRIYLNKIDIGQHEYCKVFPVIPNNEENLTEWHTFSCEWLPERVTFYRDGQVTAEEREHVPSHYLSLKANYAIDRYALQGHSTDSLPVWIESDTMYIDYIKVHQLKWDCETDEVIACQSELDGFDYGVKKIINITSSTGSVKLNSNDKVTFRATNSFQITGPFQTDMGSELTVIMQECPE